MAILGSGRVQCSLGRTWAEKDGAQPLPTLLLRGEKDCGQEQESSCNGVKAFENPFSAHVRFGEGHPSRTFDFKNPVMILEDP
jgi:hypothetical protein